MRLQQGDLLFQRADLVLKRVDALFVPASLARRVDEVIAGLDPAKFIDQVAANGGQCDDQEPRRPKARGAVQL